MNKALRKITPFLWFDDTAEEAIAFYTSLFSDSKVEHIQRYPEQVPGPAVAGKVMTGVFHLAGQRFMALDGGAGFQFTPATSLFVECSSNEEVDRFFEEFAEGGSILMPLQAYPFSPRYAWVVDRFGLSWQLHSAGGEQRISPALLFVGDHHGEAEEAMNRYVSLFPESRIVRIERYEPGETGAEGAVKYAEFSIYGRAFKAMESNLEHQFTFTEAMSFMVDCDSQEEVDRYWDDLSAGGQIQQCGWLKDRYGVSWQIIPSALPRLLTDPDKEKSNRVMNAMLQMKKIEVAKLEEAAGGRG